MARSLLPTTIIQVNLWLKRDRHGLFPAPTPDGKIDRAARFHHHDMTREVVVVLDRHSVQLSNHVANRKTGFGRSARRLNACNESSGGVLHAERFGDFGVTGWITTPNHPRSTRPRSLSSYATLFTVDAGMSKAMPMEPPDGE